MAQGLNAILNLRAKLSAINDSLRDNTLVIASLSKPVNEAQICEQISHTIKFRLKELNLFQLKEYL